MTTKILTETQIMRSTLRMIEAENNPETAAAVMPVEAGHPEQHSRYDTVDDIKFKGGMAGLRAAADLLNQASASDAGAIAKIQDILDEASTKLMFSGKAGDASGIVMRASALLNQPVTGGNIEAAKEKIAAAMSSAEGGASESAPDNHASDNHDAKPVTEQQRMRSTLAMIESVVRQPVAEFNSEDELRQAIANKYTDKYGGNVDPLSDVWIEETPFDVWMETIKDNYPESLGEYWKPYVDWDAVARYYDDDPSAADMEDETRHEFWEEAFLGGYFDKSELAQFFDSRMVTQDLDIEGSLVGIEINDTTHTVRPNAG